MRVLGIDPGTVSIDIVGLDDGRVFMDRTFPTAEALADIDAFSRVVAAAAPLDLVAGPSGYGLPLVPARDATDDDLRLACLAPEGLQGGIGGLRRLMRALAALPVPVVFTPGVIHLRSVPDHRKINRVDMGTADKLCAVVLAIHAEMQRRQCAADEISFVLVELGGAFTAAVAVDGGRVVDGIGGTSGPIGARAAGALDGEVAFLMETISKGALFDGGAASVAGAGPVRWDVEPRDERSQRAWDAYVEGAAKAAAALLVSAPAADAVLLSGRFAAEPVRVAIQERLAPLRASLDVRALTGMARVATHAAEGAALMADGLAGGRLRCVIERLGLRDAAGTVLDHLCVMSPATARRRLGLGTGIGTATGPAPGTGPG